VEAGEDRLYTALEVSTPQEASTLLADTLSLILASTQNMKHINVCMYSIPQIGSSTREVAYL
jgi:hypothetical protein